jgi:hypothetical protein
MSNSAPKSPRDVSTRQISKVAAVAASSAALFLGVGRALAEEEAAAAEAAVVAVAVEAAPAVVAPVAVPTPKFDYSKFKVAFERVNLDFGQFLGKKATIVFNMKIDDPQTVLQFPDLLEIYNRYKAQGLNALATPQHLYTSTPLHLYTSTPLHLYPSTPLQPEG